MAATFCGQLATLVPFLFGVATATLVAGEVDYVFALIQISPLWYALLLMVVAFLGGMSTGVTSLYGTGLDFSSVFPRLCRVQASLAIGVVAFVFILVGRLAFDLLASVNAFIGAIVIATTPWMVICRSATGCAAAGTPAGRLQVFNQGQQGGRYWFRDGVNWRGMVAWIPAAVVGLLFANYPPLIEGPFRNAAGGVDVSLPVSLGLAAVVYLGPAVRLPRAAVGVRAARARGSCRSATTSPPRSPTTLARRRTGSRAAGRPRARGEAHRDRWPTSARSTPPSSRASRVPTPSPGFPASTRSRTSTSPCSASRSTPG